VSFSGFPTALESCRRILGQLTSFHKNLSGGPGSPYVARSKKSICAEAEDLCLRYLVSVHRLLPFAQYAQKHEQLGKPNTKLQRACETKKNDLRNILITDSGRFLDHCQFRGLTDLATEAECIINDLVEYHRQTKEKNRRRGGGRQKSKVQHEEADEINSVESRKDNPNKPKMTSCSSAHRRGKSDGVNGEYIFLYC
jgi:hypothetical protein